MDNKIDSLCDKVTTLQNIVCAIKSYRESPDVTLESLSEIKRMELKLRDNLKIIRQTMQKQHELNQNMERLTSGVMSITREIEELEKVVDYTLYESDAAKTAFKIECSTTTSDLSARKVTASTSYRIPIELKDGPDMVPKLNRDEFRSIPKYMSGRINMDNINSFIEKINECTQRKHEMLNRKRCSLKGEEMRRWMDYKKDKLSELKDRTYFSEKDLAETLGQRGVDKRSGHLLNLLRFTKRLTEYQRKGYDKMFVIINSVD